MEGGNLISESVQVKLKFRYSYWLFFIDEFIRCIVVAVFIKGYINNFVFILIQIVLIALSFWHSDYYTKSLVKKYSVYLNPKYDHIKPIITIDDEISSIAGGLLLIIGFFFSFWFFYYQYPTPQWYNYIIWFIMSLVTMILFVIPLVFSGRFDESIGILSAIPQIVKIVKNDNNHNPVKIVKENATSDYPDLFISDKLISYGNIQLDTIDQNDVKITGLESEVKSINYRSETWMLESVFLGGLAFSGFLTVASANFLGKEPVVFRSFISHIFQYTNKCSLNNFMSWVTEIEHNFFRSDLFILIMLLCLLSSVFFFLVLILRLRLNTLSLNMDHLIRILLIFNAKEEELFNISMENNNFQIQRLEKIQQKIAVTIVDAEKLIKELQPTARLMNMYRTIAVFLFYIVLIISGFYFSFYIAIIILSLLFATQLFGLFEKYSKLERIKNLLGRH